jgi:uncharacterized protein (TIGR02001 family)
MRTSFGPFLGLIIALAAATPAFAEEEAADTSAITINGTATVVSDYRFRGISQTNKRFAAQGSLTISHESGLYASVWGSSIDDYIAAGGDQEIDLILGFKKTFGGTTVDVGGLYYYYPGAESFVPGYNSDFFEPYLAVSHTFGPVTAKVTGNYAPKSAALDYGFGKEDNFYGAFDLSAAIPNTPISLTGHLGHNFTRSFLSGGTKYTDYAIGASYTYKALTLGVSYVDANKNLFSYPAGPGINRNITKGGVVATLGVSF